MSKKNYLLTFHYEIIVHLFRAETESKNEVSEKWRYEGSEEEIVECELKDLLKEISKQKEQIKVKAQKDYAKEYKTVVTIVRLVQTLSLD